MVFKGRGESRKHLTRGVALRNAQIGGVGVKLFRFNIIVLINGLLI